MQQQLRFISVCWVVSWGGGTGPVLYIVGPLLSPERRQDTLRTEYQAGLTAPPLPRLRFVMDCFGVKVLAGPSQYHLGERADQAVCGSMTPSTWAGQESPRRARWPVGER